MTEIKYDRSTRSTDTIKSLRKDIDAKSSETEARLEGVEKNVKNLSESVDTGMAKVLEKMNEFSSSLAKNRPTQITKDGKHTDDLYEHADEHGIEFVKNPDVHADVEVIQHGMTANSAEFKAKADQMRFDEELVEVMVMPSQSQYPDHTFTIGVNGRLRLIVRGQKQWLPRKYVEVLLRAKISSYGNFETRNQYSGELEVKNPETKSHRYPLQILTDKNPKGAAWLVRVTNDKAA